MNFWWSKYFSVWYFRQKTKADWLSRLATRVMISDTHGGKSMKVPHIFSATFLVIKLVINSSSYCIFSAWKTYRSVARVQFESSEAVPGGHDGTGCGSPSFLSLRCLQISGDGFALSYGEWVTSQLWFMWRPASEWYLNDFYNLDLMI